MNGASDPAAGAVDPASTPPAAPAKFKVDDVLELTRFIEKKEWIDAKIEFLSTLPPVDAIAPDPPERSPTTKEGIRQWWLEHDRIEAEVERYDMGDLAKLKSFAKSATQHNLSPADTDLIEITLTTLFAVDKLQHLLRNRRRALTLLNYRLQWEVTVATATAEHQQILASLPRFLEKSRWTVPSPTDARPRHPARERSSSSAHSIASMSLPHSTSSSSVSSSHSALSGMQRTMRSEVLSLELAAHKSRIHSLTSVSIPETARRLDKLINTSPTPLPDPFLDVQDKIEEDAKEFTDGLGTFLADMVRQWRNADEVYWMASGVENKAEVLQREISEALLKLPKRDIADEFEGRVEGAQADLREANESLGESRRATGFLPMPKHGAIPEQAEENQDLVLTLGQTVRDATAALASADAMAKGYRFAAEALERSVALRAEMDVALKALRTFVDDSSHLDGCPDLNDPRCLAPTPDEAAFAQRFRKLASDVAPTLRATPPLLKRAAGVVVDLNKAGIDPNVRQTVKDTTSGLMSLKEKAEQALCDDEAALRRLEAARAWNAGLHVCEQAIENTRTEVLQELEASRWRKERPSGSPVDVEALFASLRQRIDAVLEQPLADARPLLSERHSALCTHLESRTSSLRTAYDSLLPLRALVANVRAQQDATTSLLSDITDIDSNVVLVSTDAESALSKTSEQWVEGGLHASLADLTIRLDAIAAGHADTTASVHLRIPFISNSSSTPPSNSSPSSHLPSTLAPLAPAPNPAAPPLPFSLEEQDQLVRSTVNEALAAASGKMDDARERLATLEDQGLAFQWDQSHAAAHAELEQLEEQVRTTEASFHGREENEEEYLATLQAAGVASAAALAKADTRLKLISGSLTRLLATPTSSSLRFNSHPERHSRFDSTSQRHAAAVASNEALLAAIKLAEEERQFKAAVEAALRARAAATDEELADATRRLDAFVDGERSLAGRPNLSSERCLESNSDEEDFDRRYRSLSDDVAAVLAETPTILDRATAVVSDLRQEELDPGSSKRIEKRVYALQKARTAVEGVQAAAANARGHLAVARSLDAALKETQSAVEEKQASISDLIERARWTAGGPAHAGAVDVDATIENLGQDLDAIIAEPLAAAKVLESDHPSLNAHLRSRAGLLVSAFASLSVLRAHLTDVQAQAAAARSGLAAAAAFAQDVASAAKEAENASAQARDAWAEGAHASKLAELRAEHLALDQRRQELAASTLANTRDLVFPPVGRRSIPSPRSLRDIAHPPPSARPAFDVVSQNSQVRDALDDALGSAFSVCQELGESVDVFRHLGEAFEWDHVRDAVEGELSALVERARCDREAFEASPRDSDEPLAALLASSSSTAAGLAQHRQPLDSLASTLSILRQHAPATTASDLHITRVAHVEDLDRRHSAAVSASASTRAAITLALDELAQLERERLAKEAEARRIDAIAQWVGRRDEFDSQVRDARTAAAKLAEEAAAETRNLQAWRSQAQADRIVLHDLDELDASSDALDGPLQHARSVQARLTEQVRALDAISPGLAASGESLAQSLSELLPNENLKASTVGAAALRAELSQSREHVGLLISALSQAASEADAWPIARARELESRREREQERRRADAVHREAELDARLVEVRKSLEEFESLLQRFELLTPSLSHSNGFALPDVPSAPRLNGCKKAESASITALEDALVRLRSNSSLSLAAAELEEVRANDAQLRNDALAASLDAHVRSPPIESLDELVLQLRRRSSALRSALEQAVEDSKPAFAGGPEASGGEAFPDKLRPATMKIRPAFTSSSDVEDVFGPTLHSMPFGDEEQDDFDGGEFGNLQRQLEDVPTETWLNEVASLRLPTTVDAQAVQRQLSLVAARLEDLTADSRSAGIEALQSLIHELDRKMQESDRIVALSAFHERIAWADSALSDLLTSIDAATPGIDLPPSSRPSTPGGNLLLFLPLSEAYLDASRAVTAARKDAVPLIDDTRVEAHINRIEQTFGEMAAMIDDLNVNLSRPTSSASSVRSSKSSLHHQISRPGSHQAPSRTPSRQSSNTGSVRISSASRLTASVSRIGSTSRPASSRLPLPLDGSLFTPRKATSSQIPTPTPRSRVSSMAATIPRAFSFGSARKASLSKSTSGVEGSARRESLTRSVRRETGLSAVHRDSTSRREGSTSSRRDSLASSTSSLSRSTRSTRLTSPTPTRRSLTGSENLRRYPLYASPPRVKTQYKPNKKRNVDVAVARVVNELPVNVPIRSAENETKIDSGMYWIGDRLYFCRILRSKTAMLRIGGGWQELSAFLLSHFSNTEEVANIQVSPSTSRSGHDPKWISSASLSKSTSSLSLLSSVPSTPASVLSLSVRGPSGSQRSPLRKASSQNLHGGGSPNATPTATKIWHS